MTINFEFVLKEESVKSICIPIDNNENQFNTDLDYTKLDFYEEKYTSTLLICNSILSHPEIKKTSLDISSFFKIFSLVLDAPQKDIIEQKINTNSKDE